MIKYDRFHEITTQLKNVKPIVVVGDVGIDKYTYGEVRRISPEAPVPVIEVTKEWRKLGLAANISHNLKTLGVDSTLCGVVGEDLNASLFENLLEDEGLKTWGIIRSSKRPTILKERVTTNTQQICRIDYESFESITSDEEKRLISRIGEFDRDHSAIILEDYAKGTLTQNVIESLISEYKDKKKLIAVDPGRSTPPLFYRGATLLKPNWQEAQIMATQLGLKSRFHEKDFKEDLKSVSNLLIEKLNLDMLVITLGAKGMALVDVKNKGSLEIIPTIANEVFDVSGAGDTAISVLTASLMAGASLVEAAWIGNCASGVVVGKKGTATVTLEELQQFFLNFTNKMN